MFSPIWYLAVNDAPEPLMNPHVLRIVTGGQTGADRGGLDFALEARIQYGGWVPKGRLDELGVIPDRYVGLVEAESADPAVRTSLNVRDSDGTVILSNGPLHSGS